MKKYLSLPVTAIGAGVVLLNISVSAQLTGDLGDKVFGGHTNYSATMSIKTLNTKGKPVLGITEHMTQWEGKARMETTAFEMFDPARGYQVQWKDGQIASFNFTGAWDKKNLDASVRKELLLGFATPGTFGAEFLGAAAGDMEERKFASRLQQIVCIQIARPDRQLTYTVYPGINGYIENPSPNKKSEPNSNIAMEAVGNETVDGHPCQEKLVTVAEPGGHKTKVKIWYAADMDNFPIQVDVSSKEANVVIQIKDVQLENPDPKVFELPEKCVRYKDVKAVLKAITHHAKDSK